MAEARRFISVSCGRTLTWLGLLAGLMLTWAQASGPADNPAHSPDAPPNPPDSILGPTRMIPREDIFLRARASDPDGDSIYIRFYYDLNDTTRNSGWLGPVRSGAYVNTQVQYPAYGTYRLVAFARDIHGAVSESSRIKQIEIGPVAVAWQVVSENVGAFLFTPAIRVTNTSVEIFATSDDSVFRFSDQGGPVPAVRRMSLKRGDAVAIESPTLSEDERYVHIEADNGVIYTADTLLVQRDSFALDSTRRDYTCPAVRGSNFFVGHGDTLYLLIRTGARLQRLAAYDTRCELLMPPVISTDGSRVFCANDSGVFCLDGSLNPLWRQRLGSRVTTALALDAAGRVYVGCRNGRLYGLDPAVGQVVFASESSDAFVGSPAIAADGAVYACRSLGQVECLFGPHPWSIRLPPGATLSCGPCLAPDSTVLVHTEDAIVYALNVSDGSIAWSINLPPARPGGDRRNRESGRRFDSDIGACPVVGPRYKRIYVAALNDAVFYALVVDRDAYLQGLPDAPWPKFQHDLRNSGWAGASISGVGAEPEGRVLHDRLLVIGPNPFTDRVRLRYSQPIGTRFTLSVFDRAGRLVRNLTPDPGSAEMQEFGWDGRDSESRLLPGGVYFIRLPDSSGSETRKLVIRR